MKQFLLLVDEKGAQAIQSLFRQIDIQCLEVQGLAMGTENKFSILATPVLPPVNPVVASPPQPPAPAPTTEETPCTG